MFKVTLLAMGNKMPSWVEEGVQEYQKRLTDTISLSVIEIPLLKRPKTGDYSRLLQKETELLLQAIPKPCFCVAMDSRGKSFTSEALAQRLENLQSITSHLCLIIGGPEGLTPELLEKCQEKWSLSTLTLPHPMVRIVLTEALYRAWSILQHHPYHK